MKRPQTKKGTFLATKNDIPLFELFGGFISDGVGFIASQVQYLKNFYNFENFSKFCESDVYETTVTISNDSQQSFEKELHESELKFESKQVSPFRISYNLQIPRGFEGLKVSKDYFFSVVNIPSWNVLNENAKGVKDLIDAGDNRNLFRHVNSDGLRVMALLAPFLENGEDPVALVAEALAELGYDIEVPDDDLI